MPIFTVHIWNWLTCRLIFNINIITTIFQTFNLNRIISILHPLNMPIIRKFVSLQTIKTKLKPTYICKNTISSKNNIRKHNNMHRNILNSYLTINTRYIKNHLYKIIKNSI